MGVCGGGSKITPPLQISVKIGFKVSIFCEVFVTNFFNKFDGVEIFVFQTARIPNKNTSSGYLKK